jgi:hypothetical protein
MHGQSSLFIFDPHTWLQVWLDLLFGCLYLRSIDHG